MTLSSRHPRHGSRSSPAHRCERHSLRSSGRHSGCREVVFFHFGPGGAGGVTANIQRWHKQFKEPVEQLGTQTEKMDVEGVPLTLYACFRDFHERISVRAQDGQGELFHVGRHSGVSQGVHFREIYRATGLGSRCSQGVPRHAEKCQNPSLRRGSWCKTANEMGHLSLAFFCRIPKITASMSSDSESISSFDLLTWFETNQKKIYTGGATVLVLALGGLFDQPLYTAGRAICLQRSV